jgi:hypothetical protein
MFELIGITGIAGVVAGSVLLSLFLAECLIGLTLRAMHAGVKRADRARLAKIG